MNKDRNPPARKAFDPAKLQLLLEHIGRLLPDEKERQAFYSCSRTPPPASLRLNTLQTQSQELLPHLHQLGQDVPWCGGAFVFPESEKGLGQMLEHAMGAYYIQAKAPMLAVAVLAPQPGEHVLDLCAAPGGKTTQIAARMQNSGLLLVNEMQSKRMPALVGNLERCGVANYLLSQAPGAMLARYFHNFFDRILVDAPCSGDGIVRKDQNMLNYWSPTDAQRLAQQQIGLLRAAYHMLRPGGSLVYSTCSLSLEENEEVLLGLLRRFGTEVEIRPVDGVESLPLPAGLAAQFPAEFSRCIRVWPQLHDTEGAFVAHLSKRAPTESRHLVGDAATWAAQATTDPEADATRRAIEDRWSCVLPCPADQVFTLSNRHLCRQPALGPAMQKQLPYFVRGGMRVARHHKGYSYLTQQTVALWGHLMQGPS
ncbi:MAG: RsmB/NOP family class I SAM-dependent RNA methyltransferase, partial [Candidatus Latescibacterota bacterium]|nr:RsmB/NOP family class I SAM-dependent RNA methyltransferase [Candidatus Latescibacterota bacterium]